MKREARCSCGQLTARTVGERLRVSVCHCLACQLRTGSAFGAQARFSVNNVKIGGESALYERQGDSGNSISFYFCPKCGATVFYRLAEHPDLIGVTWGAFAGQPFPAPTVVHYGARKQEWLDIAGIEENFL
jgi:hypothetical protein